MSVIDFSDTIIAKSDQLNAADIACSITITITDAKKLSDPDQPVHIYYEGGGKKPWKPCKSMRRVIAQVWGKNGKVDLKGKRVTLVNDPKVTWAGAEVGGIRITHMSHIDGKKVLPIRVSRNKVEKYTVLPLADDVKDELPETYDEDLKEAGDEAAALGVVSYTEWLGGLTEDQKSPLKRFHKEWTQIARKADEDEAISWE